VLLAIDVGNSHIMLGLVMGHTVHQHWRIGTDANRTADEYGVLLDGLLRTSSIDRNRVGAAAIASVVPPLTEPLRQSVERYVGCPVLVLNRHDLPAIEVRVDEPDSVGIDRLVNLVAARRRSAAPLVVVDFGTATTFDAMSSDGAFVGGAISPGIGIAADALVQNTALLPRFPMTAPASAIGVNTMTNLQSGLIFGYAGLVDGIVGRFIHELGGCQTVIATGGLAEVVAPHSTTIRDVAPLLTLEGIAAVYEHTSRCVANESSLA